MPSCSTNYYKVFLGLHLRHFALLAIKLQKPMEWECES